LFHRHLAHLRYPIVGDTTHGDGKHNAMFREHFGVHRLLLHTQKLVCTHPRTHQRITIEAPLDDAFLALLKQINLQ